MKRDGHIAAQFSYGSGFYNHHRWFMVRNDFQGIRYRIPVGYAPGVYEIYGEFPFFHEFEVSRCFFVHCQ